LSHFFLADKTCCFAADGDPEPQFWLMDLPDTPTNLAQSCGLDTGFASSRLAVLDSAAKNDCLVKFIRRCK